MDTKTESKAMQQFTETAATLNNPSLENWKEQGGKIVGYFCSSVPEELITAAGLLPFRMRAIGSEGTELSDTYFSSISCSYPRHAFDLALRGKYDFTDGVIFLNTCDHVRRLFDNWKQTVNPSFAHILSLPRKTEDPQVEWYRDELMDLKKNLENHFGVEITDDALRTAIKLHNETRHLQKQLYASRRGENPKISGTDMLVITIAGTAMPREQYNQLLRELLDDIDQSNGNDGYRARLMIVGGILDDPEYLKIIEDMGGLIVTDSLCFGSRILWKDVNETDDPLTALARYHVQERPACPQNVRGTAKKS